MSKIIPPLISDTPPPVDSQDGDEDEEEDDFSHFGEPGDSIFGEESDGSSPLSPKLSRPIEPFPHIPRGCDNQSASTKSVFLEDDPQSEEDPPPLWTANSDIRTSPEGADESECCEDEFPVTSDCNEEEFGEFGGCSETVAEKEEEEEEEEFSEFSESQQVVREVEDDEFNEFESACPVFEDEGSPSAEIIQSTGVEIIEAAFASGNNPPEDNVNNSSMLTHCLSGCLDDSSSVWGHLKDLDSSPALSLHWANSCSSRILLSSLNIDTRNILMGTKWNNNSKAMPRFAANLTCAPLEPVKAEPVVVTNTAKVEATNSEDVVPAAQFDWISSGLTNPLDYPEKRDLTSSVQVDSSTKTGDKALSKEACNVLESIPDLSFLSAKKLLLVANDSRNRYPGLNRFS